MSEKEDSELSNLEFSSTPGSSPFQQVPAHDSQSRQTTYSEDTSVQSNEYSPYLKILIQPQEHFRFRYKSEREGGTHGYLQGEYLTADKAKTFPTVELRNFSSDAIIKCHLYQHDKNEEHPHTLHEENRGDRQPKVIVSEGEGYTVYFQGLGIIHTAKRDVVAHLYDKLRQRMSEDELRSLNRARLRERCKKIDLNRVRLRFSAHDVKTDEEICAVYSRTIKNMKSAETNELKICRSSRATGYASGGQGVMLFVEKVNKGNIKVNFFENKSKQDGGWEQEATIHEVHHQLGIFITTPRYKEIDSDVQVWMELQRISDGSCSEPRQFTYTPELRHLVRKRARPADEPNRPVDQPARPVDQPARPVDQPARPVDQPARPVDHPARPVDQPARPVDQPARPVDHPARPVDQPARPVDQPARPVDQPARPVDHPARPVDQPARPVDQPARPVDQPARPVDQPAQPVINAPIIVPAEIVFKNFEDPSSEGQSSNESMENMEIADPNMEHEEAAEQDDLLDVLLSLDIPTEPYDSASDPNPPVLPSDKPVSLQHITNAFNEMDNETWEYNNFLTNHRDPLLSQSQYPLYPSGCEDTCEFLWATGADIRDVLPRLVSDKPQTAGDGKLPPDADDNDIKLDEHMQIYTLIKEICESKRTKLEEWYEEVTEKLERLYEIRLSNGDTILHLLLEEDEASLRRLASLTHRLHQQHMLRARDARGLSVLHRAVWLRRDHLLPALVRAGCDPLCTDFERNNVIHHAVKSDAATLAALLDAMAHAVGHDKHTMELKLAQCNDEGQTPLHVAVSEGCLVSTRLLLSAGASVRQAADGAGWLPLHTAVRLDRPDLVRILLENTPEQFREDVDAVIMRGQSPWYTALQLACAEARPHAAEIANLLLEYGASPLLQSARCPAAWRLARRAGGAVWAALAPRAPRPAPPSPAPGSDDSDDSDDYLSADEGDSETAEDDIAAKLGDIKINCNSTE